MAETDKTTAFDDHASAGAQTVAQSVDQAERTRLKERIAELRVVGRDMRAAQRRYFETRKREDLIDAKTLERRFDELVR